tara:strand:+ start:593 stop:886 length:294 start_codon:yes stop_codon:yes gene_type:complete
MNYKNFTFKTGRVYDYEQEIDVRVIDTTVYFRDEQRLCFAYFDGEFLINWFQEETDSDWRMLYGGTKQDDLKSQVMHRYDTGNFNTLNHNQRKEIFG